SQIADGSFRQDLYFRLAQFPVHVPPLRERRDDIPMLARHFLSIFAQEMGAAQPQVDPAAIKRLLAHPFPGNVRELKKIIERALIESGGGAVQAAHIHLTTCAIPRTIAPTLSA